MSESLQDAGDGVCVRRAVVGEHPRIIELQKVAYAVNRVRLGREPLPLLAEYDEIFAMQECWVALAGSSIVGALFLELRDDDLLIWSVATVPECQRQGVGGRLMEAAERRAGDLGRNVIRLYTGQLLTDRIEWYSRLGFEIERLEELDDRVVVHMKKTLS